MDINEGLNRCAVCESEAKSMSHLFVVFYCYSGVARGFVVVKFSWLMEQRVARFMYEIVYIG